MAPTALSATATSVSQINLSWTDNSNNESGFKIERGSAAAGPFTEIATAAAGATSYSNTGLSASTTYYYRVRSYNAIGSSSYTSVASAITQTPAALATLAISAPSILQAKSSSSIIFNLAYSNAASISLVSANVSQVKTGSASCASSVVSGSGTTARTITLSSCSGDGTIKISIAANTAQNSAGVQAVAAGPSSAFTVDNTAPSVPANFVASAASSSAINLSWTASSDAGSGLASYTVYLSGGAQVASGTATSLQLTGLLSSTAYCYQIRATDNLGNVSALSTQSCATTGTSSQAELFAQAKNIFAARCNSCHAPGLQAGAFPLNYATEAEFLGGTNPLVKANYPAQSKVIIRSIYTSGGDMYPGKGFTQAEHNTLVAWISGISTAPGTPEFTCTNPSITGASNLLRLSKNQYMNALSDLLPASVLSNPNVVTALSLLPADDDDISASVLHNVTGDQVEGYVNTAETLADLISADNNLISAIFGSAAVAATPSNTCLDSYLGIGTNPLNTAMRIFRRPLTAAEQATAKAIGNPSSPYCAKANLRRLLATHLVSPQFLFRLEMGSANDASAQFALTPYEVASRVSFAAGDSIPDAALLAAAQSGSLSTPAQIETHVRRLLSTERGKARVRNMFKQWLLDTGAPEFSTLPPDLTSGVNLTGLSAAINSEEDQFIDYIVWERNAGYKELLTSTASFASHAGLATIYEHAPANSMRTAGQATATMGSRRQGILMRANFLAGVRSRTPMIKRGVKIRRRVLCDDLPDPSQAALDGRTALEPTAAANVAMTNRTYMDTITGRIANLQACTSCHARINPTGYGFENFDSLGRMRTAEKIFDLTNTNLLVNSLTVDTNAQVPMANNEVLPVSDGFDLISNIANGTKGPACFAKWTHRYFNQRSEAPEDSCQLNDIYGELTKTNASILDAFVKSLANSVSTQRRKGQ